MDSIIPGAPLMAQSLGGAAVIDFGIQLVGWAFAAALKTEKISASDMELGRQYQVCSGEKCSKKSSSGGQYCPQRKG